METKAIKYRTSDTSMETKTIKYREKAGNEKRAEEKSKKASERSTTTLM